MAEIFLFSVVTLILVSVAQITKSEFTSIDCGAKQGYIDQTTNITYTSDNNRDTGEIHSISPNYKSNSLIERQFENLRSFPDGNRNCYTLNAHANNNNQYLIRARFMYGNYDGKGSPPEFDIYVGATWWDSVEFENASSVVTKEIIYVALSDYIHVCVCNTNKGTPFISVLELRPLEGRFHGADMHLVNLARLDLGSQDSKLVRYPDDDYDRIWMPYNSIEWKQINTSHLDYDRHINVKSYPPSVIMRTAISPANQSDNIKIFFKPKYNASSTYCVYLYSEEIQLLREDQTRHFEIFLNGDFRCDSSQFTCQGCYNGREPLEVWVNRTKESTLPPMINAMEIFAGRKILQNKTDENEYAAMLNIKRFYGIKRNWQGDPCAPLDYIWDGIECHHQGSGLHRIISLNLSSSGLNEGIANDIANLNMLEYLDLSNNYLSGDVPNFLSQLQSLRVLKLEGNQLSDPIPSVLLQKSKNRSLNFSFERNSTQCSPGSCKKRQGKMVVTLVASLSGAFIVFGTVIFWMFKTKQSVTTCLNKDKCSISKQTKVLDSNKQQFTYGEVITITNNFRRVLGKGGFGTVFHGYLGNNIQVAVKMLSPSVQGYQQFQAEAELLTKVHHKCLTALIGYCEEGTNVALIYEYMANGDLAQHLSAKSEQVLGWKARLQIVVDAAEGLEYMHNGCKPPIVHRDIKPQNILLNENMRGKLGDFGLSKIFSDEDDTHVSTVIAGTRGYLDPEYFMSNRLTEKSDVFSFGIVLLEIITGQPSIAKNEERTHIVEWLDSMKQDRQIDEIVDSRLQGEFCPISAKKALDTATACVKSTSINRPTMTQVVIQLKECLAMEMTRTSDNTPHYTNESSSIDIISGESYLARE